MVRGPLGLSGCGMCGYACSVVQVKLHHGDIMDHKYMWGQGEKEVRRERRCVREAREGGKDGVWEGGKDGVWEGEKDGVREAREGGRDGV